VLGVSPDSVIILPASLDARATAAGQKDLGGWLRETEHHHPAILAARAAVQAAQDEVTSARSAGRPTVDLTANYYQNGFPDQGQAYADAQSAARNIQVSEDLLNAAQGALESSRRRYAQGVTDIVELLNAQAALADARRERTRSLAE
jgi:outer membrane protein